MEMDGTVMTTDFGENYYEYQYSKLYNDATNNRLVVKPRQLSAIFAISEQQLPKVTNQEQMQAEEENDNLYSALRFFLRFARILGIIPLTGLITESKSSKLKFRYCCKIIAIYQYFRNQLSETSSREF